MTWNQWVDRHAPAALLFARQITGSLADAEDSVQEGFMRFWKHRHGAREPVALLYAGVRSAALDLKRSAARRRVRDEKAALQSPMLTALDSDAAARRDSLERALAELPLEQREVVILKIWSELTFAQIADALQISANTAASRYRYALEKLSTLLTPEVNHG